MSGTAVSKYRKLCRNHDNTEVVIWAETQHIWQKVSGVTKGFYRVGETCWMGPTGHRRADVSRVKFSNSDSVLFQNFWFQILIWVRNFFNWESDSYSNSGVHRSKDDQNTWLVSASPSRSKTSGRRRWTADQELIDTRSLSACRLSHKILRSGEL